MAFSLSKKSSILLLEAVGSGSNVKALKVFRCESKPILGHSVVGCKVHIIVNIDEALLLYGWSVAMSHNFHLDPGHVHLVYSSVIENIPNHVPQHPVAVVRAPIGKIWHGAMRTSKRSSVRGGSIPSAPIPALNLLEEKNWNVDPVLNVLASKANTKDCVYRGELPRKIKEEVIDLYKSWGSNQDKEKLDKKIIKSLSKRYKRR